MSARLLVVNGDDFGLTPGVNRGIVEAFRRGVLTSASMFASARATDEAIALAASAPGLGVGCHLTLVDGVSVLPASRIPTLVGDDGMFRPTWRSFVMDCLLGRVSLADVEQELTAQVEKLMSAGIELTHLDSHKHVHAYPPVFEVVTRLAVRFGVGTIRVPFERPALRLLATHAGRPAVARQAAQNLALAHWARRDLGILVRAGGLRAPNFLGRIHTGAITPDAFRSIVGRVRPGINELMLHPGYVDEALGSIKTRLREERAAETALACSPETRVLIAAASIKLVNHRGTPHPFTEESQHA